MKINDHEIKGIIFDLDGTILDSCSIWADIDRDFFEKRGMEKPDDYSDAIGHIGLERAAVYTIKRFHLNETKEEILNEWKQGALDYYKNRVNLKPHVKEFLQYLKANNIPFCVATANDEDCYKSALVHHGIYEDFEFILEASKYQSGKDDPTIYIDAANKLGVSINECCVFEDLSLPIKTAKKAGFFCVAVKDNHAKDEEIKKRVADIYIEDFAELIK